MSMVPFDASLAGASFRVPPKMGLSHWNPRNRLLNAVKASSTFSNAIFSVKTIFLIDKLYTAELGLNRAIFLLGSNIFKAHGSRDKKSFTGRLSRLETFYPKSEIAIRSGVASNP